MALTACSSPAVAEFSVTNNSGSAPLDVSFILGETADADSYSWDFGDGSGSTELEPSHTFQDAGAFSVRLTATRGDSTAVADTTITVEPGEAGWVVIEGGDESVESFETTQFTAAAFDVLGNPITDAVLNWNVDSAAGEIDEFGLFTAGTNLGSFDGAIYVTVERLGVTVVEDVGIQVVEGPLHTFAIEPATLVLQAGRTQTISVQAVDEAGHDLDSALVLFTTAREEDTVNSTGLFSAGLLASVELEDLLFIEVELDGVVIEAIVTGTVQPGILDQVHVSVMPRSLGVGESHQLEAFATDRFGNKIDLDELQWSVSHPDIGSISDSGLFTAGSAAGSHVKEGIIARGILNGVESVKLSPVMISGGNAVSIHIFPESDSVPIGAGSPFVVLALDEHGNVLDIDQNQYVFSYSTAGRGTESAVFIAGYETGDFENAITVTLPAGSSGNESELTVQSDVSIRQRSSNIIAVEVVDQDGSGIFFIDLETAQIGSADVDFHENGAVELSPGWWPDGSRLVYVSDPTGELQVYTLELSTREIVRLTDFAGGVSMPNISSDGTEIVFVSLANDEWQIYVAEIPEDVGTNPITLEDSRLISDDAVGQHILPFWSSDSTQILASQNTPDGQVRVMLFDPKAETPPEIIGPFGSVGFGWNSDGSGVHVGLATAEGALDLGTLDIASNEAEFIESNLEFHVAAWAPDDSEVVMIDSLLGAGWIVDSDGTGLRRIVSSEQVPTRMSWRPRAYGDPVPLPAFEGEPLMLTAGDAPRAPVGALDTTLSYSAVISTDAGEITVDLFDDLAPMTVENFINLSRIGFYDGLDFHRVLENIISQAGDPPTDADGPGYIFNDEFSRELQHDAAGVISMANAGSNTNGSQLFFTHSAARWLDAYDDGIAKNCADDLVSCHSVFGRVTNGLEIVTGMSERDPETATEPGVKILSISIIES